MPSSANSLWGNYAGGLCKTSGKITGFYTVFIFYIFFVNCLVVYALGFSKFIHGFINKFFVVFSSVLINFLNTIHILNKNNNKIYISFNNNYLGV